MSTFPATRFEPIVEAAYQPCDDGVRRWRDLDIAEWLGLEQPRTIRTVIENNRSELELHGNLMALPSYSGERGRPGTDYWLIFEQAMVLCAVSRTPRAVEVRTVMVQVFTKVVNGGISTLPRMELRALEVAADRIVTPILVVEREFHSQVLTRMDRHEGRLAFVEHEMVDMKKALGSKRRDFTEKVRHQYIGTVTQYYNGKCPCCRKVLIVRDGQLLSNAEFDHWHSPAKRRADQGWLICSQCNAQLYGDSEFKTAKYGAFTAFQDALSVCIQEARDQGSFDFGAA
jgi:hypothetical protein